MSSPPPPRILVATPSPSRGREIAAWLDAWTMMGQVVHASPAASEALASRAFDLLVIDPAFPPAATGSIPRLIWPASGTPDEQAALHAAILACLAAAAPPNGIDHSAIAEQWVDSRTQMFRRVAAMFLEEAPQRLDAIDAAQAAGDRDRLAHEAHALAGAGLNVGMAEIVRLARELEHGAPDQPWPTLALGVAVLRAAAGRDFAALAQLNSTP